VYSESSRDSRTRSTGLEGRCWGEQGSVSVPCVVKGVHFRISSICLRRGSVVRQHLFSQLSGAACSPLRPAFCIPWLRQTGQFKSQRYQHISAVRLILSFILPVLPVSNFHPSVSYLRLSPTYTSFLAELCIGVALGVNRRVG
jgi:hypothetical protein